MGRSLGLATAWSGLCLVDAALQLVVFAPADPGESFESRVLGVPERAWSTVDQWARISISEVRQMTGAMWLIIAVCLVERVFFLLDVR